MFVCAQCKNLFGPGVRQVTRPLEYRMQYERTLSNGEPDVNSPAIKQIAREEKVCQICAKQLTQNLKFVRFSDGRKHFSLDERNQ